MLCEVYKINYTILQTSVLFNNFIVYFIYGYLTQVLQTENNLFFLKNINLSKWEEESTNVIIGG